MQILTGLIGIILGIFYTIYSNQITDTIGPISWIEQKIGAGSSYSFHKLLGVLIIMISLMWTTGTFQLILKSTFGKLFGI